MGDCGLEGGGGKVYRLIGGAEPYPLKTNGKSVIILVTLRNISIFAVVI